MERLSEVVHKSLQNIKKIVRRHKKYDVHRMGVIMSREDEILFCKGGGCTAKLGAGVLAAVLEKLPQQSDPRLLVGFDRTDYAPVYKLSDEIAVVQTLDFFPRYWKILILSVKLLLPMRCPISMRWGTPIVALNIVCFPEQDKFKYSWPIMQGGQEKETKVVLFWQADIL